VITPPASAPPLGLTYTLTDNDGNALYTTTGVYEPGSTAAAYLQTTYQLFNGNSVTLSGANITCASPAPSMSLPCATIDADGNVTQLSYDSAGDLVSSATPDGNGTELAATTYTYDADGEQTSTTSPDGNVSGATAATTANFTVTSAYNSDGKLTAVTEAGGSGATATPRTTTYGYDADSNQTSAQDARGFTTNTAYDADDEATLVTNPDGDKTLTCYDNDGRVAQTVPPVGVAANSLTPASCPTSYPSGYSTRLASDATVSTYNTLGQLTQRTTPAPAGQTGFETYTYTYDADGNETSITQPSASTGGAGQVTSNTYNDAGELATQTTGSGTAAASTISYCYDPDGNETALVYADGNVSAVGQCETASPWIMNSGAYPTQAGYQSVYAYDSADELVSTTTPATSAAPHGAATAQTYDPNGNELTSTDPNGVTTTSTYTPLNLPASVSYSGSSAHSVTYQYDADGAMTSLTDATGTSNYAYDAFGERASATNGAGQVTGYGYNSDGAVTSITYPLPSAATWATSDTVTYGYDHANEMTSVTDFNGNAISITNTADGKPSSEGLAATGDTVSTTYDNAGTASAIALKNSTSTLQSFTYSDAPAGNTLTETDTPSSSRSPATYTYDAQERITSDTPGSGTALSYGSDASYNLTTLPGGEAGTYDHAGELTSAATTPTATAFSYNADGERVSGVQGTSTVMSAAWNGAGQLTSCSNAAADLTSASYDGDGLRASSATTPAGGSSQTQQYVWKSGGAGTPQLIMDSTSAYVYGTGQAPAEQVNLATGSTTYLVADRLGSVRGTVNNSGTLTGTTSYDAWGNPQASGGLTASTPFGFAGGYTDPDGLIYFINRYYDPSTGQFISVDPDLSQTNEPYAYTDDNPATLTDPTGNSDMVVKDFGGTITGCIGGNENNSCVNFKVSDGQFAFEVSGTGGYIHGFTAYAITLSRVWYPQFRYVVETPKGKRYRYYSGRWKGGQRAFGNLKMWVNWPVGCHYGDGGHWTYVGRTFPVTSQAASQIHTYLYVEDPHDASIRAAVSAPANITLSN
jgi:RHS repeat-associated protein